MLRQLNVVFKMLTKDSLVLVVLFLTGVCSSPVPGELLVQTGSTFTKISVEESRHRHMDSSRMAFIAYRDESGEIVSNASELGKYGEGFVGPVTGEVHHVVSGDEGDHTGCSKPWWDEHRRPLPPPSDHGPWIALIKRGMCNFENKVRTAYSLGAAAVVVYDDKDRDHLDRMKLNTDAERNISAVFTFKWKGEEIVRHLENGHRIILDITVGSHTFKPFPNINRTSVLFVSLSFIVLMIISLTWLIFYYVQRFRISHAKDKLSKRLCTAAKKALAKIPTKTMKLDDKEMDGDGECCAVCIEPYKVSDVLRILPCKHEFHKYCIDPWLLEHRTCPMCKMDILKHYGFVYTGSQESILQLDLDEPGGTGTPNSPIPPSPSVPPADLQVFQSSSNSEVSSNGSSRASSPNELTPSLGNMPRGQRSDLCVSCLANMITASGPFHETYTAVPPEHSNNSSTIQQCDVKVQDNDGELECHQGDCTQVTISPVHSHNNGGETVKSIVEK